MLQNLYLSLIKLIKIVAWILFSCLIIVVFYSVLSRFVLRKGISWSEELARFLFIWVTFLGAVLVNNTYGHMNLDFLVTHLKQRQSIIVKVFATSIVLILTVILLFGSIVVVYENWTWKSSALEVPYGYIYAVLPFCLVIMALQSVLRITKLLKGFFKTIREEKVE